MTINNYIIETEKNISNKTIASVSDLHISEKMKQEKLTEVLDSLQNLHPTHIVIPGDLYNVDYETVYSTESKVSEFLKDASDIAEVYYVPGNTELKSYLLPYNINGNPDFHYLCDTFFDYMEEENNQETKNIISLKDMNIAGIKLNDEFYRYDEKTKIQILLNKYKDYLEQLSKECEPEKFNILLCHDPIITEVHELLQNFDLIVSGHNHGGLFSKKLKPFFKLIGANLDLLYPTYTDGMYINDNTTTVINEGVTKYHSQTGILQPLEKFHESSIDVIRVRTINTTK